MTTQEIVASLTKMTAAKAVAEAARITGLLPTKKTKKAAIEAVQKHFLRTVRFENKIA